MFVQHATVVGGVVVFVVAVVLAAVDSVVGVVSCAVVAAH